jgi:3',5'-cyclic AMP phosphodiesterase CpdA
MLIAHLSDFHVFTATSETSLVRPDIVPVVEAIVADVAAFRPAVDAVMLTGDLADGGTAADYAEVRRLLAPLAVPVFPVPGNHDRRDAFRTAFADVVPFEAGPFLNYAVAWNGIRILALDTVIEGSPCGRLCPERLAWLEDHLARPWGGRTFILMHHPPFLTGIRFLDGISLIDGGEAFGRLVARASAAAPGSVTIFAGHVHRPSQSLWNGALATIGGSAAFQVALELDGPVDVEPPLTDAPYTWFLHRHDDRGDVSVHACPVDLPARDTNKKGIPDA